MIGWFRQLRSVNLFILIIFTLALRVVLLLKLPDALHYTLAEPYAWDNLGLPLPPQLSPAVNALLAAVLTLLQAVWVNYIINKNDLVPRQGQLGALMYVLLCSLFEPFMVLSAPLLVNFILIFVLDRLMLMGKTTDAVLPMFDIGLAVGAGTMLYFPFIAMAVLIWLALLVYRAFYWREWAVGILGIITPWFFLAVAYYWRGMLPNFVDIWLPFTQAFKANFLMDYRDFLVLIPYGAVFIMALVRVWRGLFSSFVAVRKNYQVLLMLIGVAALAYWLKPEQRVSHFILLAMPLASILAYWFSVIKKPWFYEGVFWALVLCQQYFIFV